MARIEFRILDGSPPRRNLGAREEDVKDETTGHGRWVGVTAEQQRATQWWAFCTALEQILAQVNGYLD
jgi:hypothetical protein